MKKKEIKTTWTLIFLFGILSLQGDNFLNTAITGKEFVCEDATEIYTTDDDPFYSYNWFLSSGGTLLSNGNSEISVHWDLGTPGSGPHDLHVTITDAGGTQTTHILEVWFQDITSLSCNNQVNVTLGLNGEAEIQPEILLNDNFPSYDNFEVDVTDDFGFSYGNTANCNHLGETVIGKVTDICSGNSCWSYLLVEDKTGPNFDCPTVPIAMICHEDYDNYPHPDCWDNCSGTNDMLVVFLGQEIDDSDVCSEVWITRNWMAVDGFGNESYCDQILHIDNPSLVDFPKDTSWSCDVYADYPNVTDVGNYTDSLHTTASGIPLGVNGLYCAYNFNHTDDTLSSCGNTIKILRTWVVFNWCTNDVVVTDSDGDNNEQLIEIADNTPPEITVPTITVNANKTGITGALCRSTGLLPPPEVTDNCNNWTTKIFTSAGEVEYVSLSGDASEGGYIPNPGLPIGDHFVTYQATDDCGNIGQTQVLVQVRDLKEPNAVCDYLTDVNINNTGEVEVFAETFDDGSYDNCCIDFFEVKKMDEPDSYFSESVIFDCSDDQETVVFRVWDCFGNANICMVEVTVQDNIMPVCIPPDDLTISCVDIPTGLDLSDTDKLTELFGEASDHDNCGSEVEELTATGSIYCGDGFINRHFVSTDNSGNLSASCFQHITIEGISDWKIHFPADWTGDCGSTEDSDEVTIENDGCDLFAVSYEDQLYNVSSDTACMQILRTWEIINWCDYLPNSVPLVINGNPDGDSITHLTHGNFYYYSYQQTIWITDGAPPVLNYYGETDFCSLDNNCSTGNVDIPVDIEDECTDDIHIEYLLDLNRDGTTDGSGNGEFEGTIPMGEHVLVYTVTDGCGNESDLTIEFTVKDCKKPVAYCENGLLVEMMQTMEVEVPASALDAGSYDNCPGDLIFSFSSDTTHTTQIFNCDHIIDIQIVEIWVTDAAGNQGFCHSFIDIQDNMWSCEVPDPLTVSGVLETESGEGVGNTEMSINGNETFTTEADGFYEFSDLTVGEDYSITALKNSNPLNGVSTFDLVLISKHILALEQLDSPYKIIAADINRSGSVTTFDLVELRKLILHIEDEFSNNNSWRFIEKAYEFQNPSNPLNEQFPETIDYNNLDENQLDADFIAVKVGDVNGNANPNNLQNSDDRSFGGELKIKTENTRLKADRNYIIDFKSTDFDNISGFQFTLNFDNQSVDFQNVISGGLLSREHFGTTRADEGIITLSWHNSEPISMAENEILFSLEFKTKSETTSKDMFAITSRLTPAEAYQTLNNESEFLSPDLIFDEENSENEFILYQNEPNPFSDETVVRFQLPDNSRGKFSVTDLNGRIVFEVEDSFEKGLNEIKIDRPDFPQTGVFFYRLDTPRYSATKKMVVQ